MNIGKLLSGEGLKARALRGSALRMAKYAASHVLRLVSSLILTRLLFPEAFGLMALVYVVLHGLNMLSNVGTRSFVIQNRNADDPLVLDTVWTVQICRGALVWIAACLFAAPVAWIYEQPILGYLIPVAALSAIIGGFNSTSIPTSERHLKLTRLLVLELLAQVAGLITAVALAMAWPSVWVLVAGALASSVLKLALSHSWLATRRNRLRWNATTIFEIVHFGKWIFLASVLGFVAAQADRLLLGKLVSIEALGIYSIGLLLASVPVRLVRQLSSSILLSVLSRDTQRNDNQLDVFRVYQARSSLLPAAMVMMLGIVLFAPWFFETLYDPRYHQAGWMAQLIIISSWLNTLIRTLNPSLIASGKTRPGALTSGMDLVATILGCLLGFHWFGLPGLIAGYAAGKLAALIILHLQFSRLNRSVFAQDLYYSFIFLILALIGCIDTSTTGAMTVSQPGENLLSSLVSMFICVAWTTFVMYRAIHLNKVWIPFAEVISASVRSSTR